VFLRILPPFRLRDQLIELLSIFLQLTSLLLTAKLLRSLFVSIITVCMFFLSMQFLRAYASLLELFLATWSPSFHHMQRT
jgi:hypothetical protein